MKKNYEAPLLEMIGFVTPSVLEDSNEGSNFIPSQDSGSGNDSGAFSPFGGH